MKKTVKNNINSYSTKNKNHKNSYCTKIKRLENSYSMKNCRWNL